MTRNILQQLLICLVSGPLVHNLKHYMSFGVHQRFTLLEKGGDKEKSPHQLIMTATPIPRTLSMTVYGALDTSIIDELPPGRRPVETTSRPNSMRSKVIKRIEEVCLEG